MYSIKYSDKWRKKKAAFLFTLPQAPKKWTNIFPRINSEVERSLIPELNFICFLNLAKTVCTRVVWLFTCLKYVLVSNRNFKEEELSYG